MRRDSFFFPEKAKISVGASTVSRVTDRCNRHLSVTINRCDASCCLWKMQSSLEREKRFLRPRHGSREKKKVRCSIFLVFWEIKKNQMLYFSLNDPSCFLLSHVLIRKTWEISILLISIPTPAPPKLDPKSRKTLYENWASLPLSFESFKPGFNGIHEETRMRSAS